ncbi:MAG: zinc-dependent alcohol dehydrogenase family protein [Proteobacteria bacterium]|nr:zinc-dependent alcohol dehydrogenase family protein [Pseudomonadota bacterium]
MYATLMHGPRDVRYERVADPKIEKPTDAIIKLSATCICGSDLWSYRGLSPQDGPAHMGHEYCGTVIEVGSDVRTIRPGQFVVGSFCLSDNTCPHCKFGFHSSCQQREFMTGAQAPYARVALADGTLVATRDMPNADMIPHMLAASDVLGTGWYAADAAQVRKGGTAVVVGDGAVGLMGVLAASQMGAGRMIAMSRHATRQQLAREFGATDIVEERGADGIARVMDLTDGIGAESVLECVGMDASMEQAMGVCRPGGTIGFVGVPHGVSFDGQQLFFKQQRMLGGPAPVRRFLPDLMDRVLKGAIQPGKVFDLVLPIAQVAEGYKAMDERRAIKTLLRVDGGDQDA